MIKAAFPVGKTDGEVCRIPGVGKFFTPRLAFKWSEIDKEGTCHYLAKDNRFHEGFS